MSSTLHCHRIPIRLAAPMALALLTAATPVDGQAARLTLDRIVRPDTVVENNGTAIEFALNGHTWFKTLNELFAHIDGEAGRWSFPSDDVRRRFAEDLLNRGVESRVVSMYDERMLDAVVTHTSRELTRAIDALPATTGDVLFAGAHWRLDRASYRRAFLRVQARWKTSLNCWSAAPTIQARVLSNWYIIDEGITLFGATYDSTEHFWQAVKYHPGTRVSDVQALLRAMEGIDWDAWSADLARTQDLYLRHAHAIGFLRHNLSSQRRTWFRDELTKAAPDPSSTARTLQQRTPDMAGTLRFTALQEKLLWGDLADLFHLIVFFTELDGGRYAAADVRRFADTLQVAHFDQVYLPGYRTGRMGFISPEFRQLMLEIWKVKFLRMARFGEVISSIQGVRLDHFLNDGDSPDIPIPVYVRYLNQIRDMARAQARRTSGAATGTTRTTRTSRIP